MKHLKRATPLLVLVTTTCCLLATGRPGHQAELASATQQAQAQARETTTTGSSVITNPSREQTTITTTPSASRAPPVAPETSPASESVQQKVPTTTTAAANASPSQQTVALSATQRTSQLYQYVRPNSANAASLAQASSPATVPVPSTPSTPSTPSPAALELCTHANRSYAIGQRWNDDCLQVCECVRGSKAEPVSACRPRCPTYADPPGDNCKLQRSKLDECCLEWTCELDAKRAPNEPDSARPTTTVMQTERGQLNVSTTEIKMPTTTTSAPTNRPTSSSAQPTTTTTITTSGKLPTAPQQASSLAQQPASSGSKQRNLIAQQSARSPKQVSGLAATTTPLLRASRPFSPPPITTTTSTLPPSSIALNDPPAESATEAQLGEVDPTVVDLCIPIDVNATEGYRLNDEWLDEGPCNRSCRCVFDNAPRDPSFDVLVVPTANLRPGSRPTEIRCSMPVRCMPLVSQLLATRPSADCPAPRLELPQSQQSIRSCACPTLSCGSGNRPLSLQNSGSIGMKPANGGATQTTTTTTRSEAPLETSSISTAESNAPQKPNGCYQMNRRFEFGDEFNDECHSVCRCSEDGKIRCKPLQCAGEPVGDLGCSEWAPEPDFKPSSSENKCCPRFVCKKAPADSSTLASTQTTNTAVAETSSELPSAELAPEANESNRSCILLGKRLPHGERVPEEMQEQAPPQTNGASGSNEDECSSAQVCLCRDGKIFCQPLLATCNPLGESPPDDLECMAGTVARVALEKSTGCCPRWTCQAGLESFEVHPVNGSTAEVTIVLPRFAIGHRGRAEIDYTSVSNSSQDAHSELPPADARWSRKPSIKTASGIFKEQIIFYYLHDLKPQHRYWFKILVRFEDTQESPFDEPLEGKMRSIVMPSLEEPDEPSTATEPSASQATTRSEIATAASASSSTTTTTTTTTTTAVPPTRLNLTPARLSTVAPVQTVAGGSSSSTQAPSSSGSSTTVTSPAPSPGNSQHHFADREPKQYGPIIVKTDPLDSAAAITTEPPSVPCSHRPSISTTSTTIPLATDFSDNHIDQQPTKAESRQPLAWTEPLMNAPLHKYAWHLLYALSVMTILFVIVSYLYLKKSVRVIAPITSASSLHHSYQNHSSSAYDNPTFTKLVSYYANQPHVLLVDENSQNYANDDILAKQKNLEVDKSSPLNNGNTTNTSNTNQTSNNNNKRTTNYHNQQHHHHHHHHHPPHQVHHQNGGRQNLI